MVENLFRNIEEENKELTDSTRYKMPVKTAKIYDSSSFIEDFEVVNLKKAIIYGSDDEELKMSLNGNLLRRQSVTDTEDFVGAFSSSSSDFEKIEKNELSPNIRAEKHLKESAETKPPFFTIADKKKVKGKKRKAIKNFFGKAIKVIQSTIVISPTCHCPKEKGLPYCDKVKKWIFYITTRKERSFTLSDSEKIYQYFGKKPLNADQALQIKKDIDRTYPKSALYSDKFDGQEQLSEVLKTISKHDPKCGYVQGMNFVVGALLYHASEATVFWLFQILLEEYSLRENYVDGLPGVLKHVQMLDRLIKGFHPHIYQHFENYGVIVQLFTTNWIVSIFTSIIPIRVTGYFFDNFFREGWIFLYKLVLHILDKFSEDILSNDFVDHIINIKPQKNKLTRMFTSTLKLNEKANRHMWKRMIDKSIQIELNVDYIETAWSHFDYEKRAYGITIDPEKLVSTKQE